MNLAAKDIRHNLGRFSLTTIGIGMLLMVVMGMGGIYRGIVEDATLLIDRIGADLWLVQRHTRGPFAELSRVPPNLVHRALAVPGVRDAREFVYHTIQREHNGKPFRMAVLGLSWPGDKGEWVPLRSGRALGQNHFEMITDETLGLHLGERLGAWEGDLHRRRHRYRHDQFRWRWHRVCDGRRRAGDSIRHPGRGGTIGASRSPAAWGAE